ncbi:MAG: hypothetical protein WC812_04425 [Candidatus Pacearchaeota archaeon]|jgi:hypothetical protein
MTDIARYGDSIYFHANDIALIKKFIDEKKFSKDSKLDLAVNSFFLPRLNDIKNFFEFCESSLEKHQGVELSPKYLLDAGEKEYDDSGRSAYWCSLERDFLIKKSDGRRLNFNINGGISKGPYSLQPLSFRVGINFKQSSFDLDKPFIPYLWEIPLKDMPEELDGIFIPKNLIKILDNSIKNL